MNTRYRVALMAFYLDGKHEEKTPKALLQKRGRRDYFKMTPQTWPDVCQATVQGKVIASPPEQPFSAIQREIFEELGDVAGHAVVSRLLNYGTLSQRIIHEDHEKKIGVFGLMIDPQIISAIRLEPISGGLISVTEDDIPRLIPAEQHHRTTRHRSIQDVVMPYVIPALRKGFERIRETGTI